MYTSIALAFALGFFPGRVAQESSPQWLADYHQARKLAQKDSKPVAVFVGLGADGFSKVSREGLLDAKARNLLVRHYVCVYLDTSRPATQRLVADLEISRGRGLIISDRSGEFQAFHHDGDLSAADLARHLERFAKPELNARITEENSHISYYSPPPRAVPSFVPIFRGGGRGC
jgi:hypothetical protein